MEFPRNIRLSTDVKNRLISYLNEEIITHRAERSNWVNDLKDWQIDYWAKPLEEVKTFPFKGACNLVIPLTAIAVESVHAKEMTSLTAIPGQFVTLKLPPVLSESTQDCEKIIDHILVKDSAFIKFADTVLLENKKLGSAVGKSGYTKIIKRAIKEVGGVETPFDVITKQGATIEAVSLPNFLMPFVCNDPQTSPWCGEEHLKSPYEVKLLSESNFFYPEVMKDLEDYISMGQGTQQSSATYLSEVRKAQDQTPVQWPREIAWFEIWLAFDVDGDGKDEEIVVHYHYESNTFFSVRYNWHDDLRRPYRICNYFPMEHRWAGIGIGKQNEQFQMEVTTQHRQRIDNATLANMRMYKIKAGLGYGPNEPVFPGKIWLVENMDEIDSVQMAEVYPSSYNNEQQAVIYSQQRTGVNELNQGMPQAGTPGTASSDLARLEESGRKFDYTYQLHSKPFLLDCAKDILCNVNQFGVSDPRIFKLVTNGPIIEVLLTQLKYDEMKLFVLSELDIAGKSQNKLTDRATWLQLGQVTQQYWQGVFQLIPLMANPQMAALAQQAILGSTEAYKQILEAFDVRSIDKFISPQLLQVLVTQGPQLAGLLGSGQPTNGPQSTGIGGGGNSGSPPSPNAQ